MAARLQSWDISTDEPPEMLYGERRTIGRTMYTIALKFRCDGDTAQKFYDFLQSSMGLDVTPPGATAASLPYEPRRLRGR